MCVFLVASLLVLTGSYVKGQDACLQSDAYPRLDVAFRQGQCPQAKPTACEKIICSADADTYEHHTCSAIPLCRDEANLCYLVDISTAGKNYPHCCREQRKVCPSDTEFNLHKFLTSLTARK